jgi:hypothetical protein
LELTLNVTLFENDKLRLSKNIKTGGLILWDLKGKYFRRPLSEGLGNIKTCKEVDSILKIYQGIKYHNTNDIYTKRIINYLGAILYGYI